jgi:hypothetical protein
MHKMMFCALSAGSMLVSVPAVAQGQSQDPEMIATTYRAAPGHQTQLLQWLARSDEADRAAGVPACQLYVHLDGASWDYLRLCRQPTPQQEQAIDAALLRMGGPQGWQNGIELRKHVAVHEDTMVLGPTTAAEHLTRIGAPAR